MGGGAWPFLVRGLICLVNSDNERDLGLPVGVRGGVCCDLSLPPPLDQGTSWRDDLRLARGSEAITGL
jgi:hypothetical protein